VVVTAALDLATALRASIDAVLVAEGLTDPLASALWVLDPARGAQSRKALASQLRCDPSNVTLLADRLAALGLVRRVPDPDDRRVRALVLTPEGADVRARVLHSLTAAAPCDRLGDEDLHQLGHLLQRTVGGADVPPDAAHAGETQTRTHP